MPRSTHCATLLASMLRTAHYPKLKNVPPVYLSTRSYASVGMAPYITQIKPVPMPALPILAVTPPPSPALLYSAIISLNNSHCFMTTMAHTLKWGYRSMKSRIRM